MNEMPIDRNQPPPISAVVVTYQPEAVLLDNLRRLCNQVAEIVLVDNGSSGAAARFVESAGKLPGVRLICNETNLGIAAALNIGIRHALQSGRSWVATFDQDSAISEHYFEQLFTAYAACPSSPSVGMIVPGGWGDPRRAVRKETRAPTAWSFVPGAVNSGSLIKTAVFPATGFFDESLFIDYVDTDFCLRLQKSGFKILSATAVFLAHELGEKQTCRWLGLPISFRSHAVWRYYYIVRNRLLLYRRHALRFPRWFLHDAGWLLLELGRILCLENQPGPKLRAAFRGFMDAVCGRTGRHPEFPPSRR